MTLQHAELTIDGSPNNLPVGTFVFNGNLELTPGMRTGFLMNNSFSTLIAQASALADNDDVARKGAHLDLGGGQHTVEIRFQGWEGSTGQWGDTGNGGTTTDATGEGPISQIDVLMHYLVQVKIDSTNPATLAYGEYSSSGRYSPLDVVIEQPTFTRVADSPSTFDGQLTCIATAKAPANTALDATLRR